MALKTERVYSPIKDDNIKKDIQSSKIWEKCEHQENIKDIDISGWLEYTIKFDGLEPIQCTKIKKMK